jgi:hypothetical protein
MAEFMFLNVAYRATVYRTGVHSLHLACIIKYHFFIFQEMADQTVPNSAALSVRCWNLLQARYHSRFFVQVGYETTYAAIGNHHFSLKHVIVTPTKIIKDLCKANT